MTVQTTGRCALVVALALGALGCNWGDASCVDLDEAAAYECATDAFWYGLQVDRSNEGREAAYDVISDVLEAFPQPGNRVKHAHLRFHRGQMAMAMNLENGMKSYLESIVPDLQAAMNTDPTNPLYPTWLDSMDVTVAGIFQDWERLEEIKDRVVDNALAFPEGNIPSISGTTIGLPMFTGYPQLTIELFEDHYPCVENAWCQDVNSRAPYAMPGMNFHWAEQYLRMGNRQRALHYLERARGFDEYNDWPFRHVVDNAYENIDEELSRWAALGENGAGSEMSYSNSSFGCMFCHTLENAR